ncbi:uncharacterized protein DUF3300 [Luteibacter rhizovicinus]|uniref:Uncharacterized protein DUF3300 n=1 Tax=Luteibacter rhizovicinus TaxID=242606 RepID=A0A4R3YZN3_9GAMM|nr:DUF3300 domain-containing protein [Luteibacter rhizovicinus]TCV97378.1 uncharacterized protein DUF3300 [Luteibacter rhizovicinus]
MKTGRQGNRWLPGVALCIGTLSIAACQKSPDAPAIQPAAASTAAQPGTNAQAYVPPTADQLYQLVAPIALFPDKLVAQTLAASAYPDQVTAADAWMQQNRGLKPAALIDAANAQPWDPSVKSLTAFPSVIDQLARNIDWTTSLGDAYVNDPNDVLNAIQVMRQRAQAHGNLRSTPQQKVAVVDRTSYSEPEVVDSGDAPVVYEGPSVVQAPERTIVIEPEQSDVVYVPAYDPGVVYGDEVEVYRGYDYRPPPRYSTGDMVATGVISFGVGVLIGEAFSHHDDRDRRDWGWHAWNMNWGGGGRGDGPGRPEVVYNNRPYVSHSTTIINRVTNNNTTINRNVTQIDNRHNFNNGNVNNISNVNSGNRNVAVDRRPEQAPGAAPQNFQRPALAAQPGQGRPAPDFAHMQRPNFTEQMTRPNQPVPAAQPGRPQPSTPPAERNRGNPNPNEFTQRDRVPLPVTRESLHPMPQGQAQAQPARVPNEAQRVNPDMRHVDVPRQEPRPAAQQPAIAQQQPPRPVQQARPVEQPRQVQVPRPEQQPRQEQQQRVEAPRQAFQQRQAPPRPEPQQREAPPRPQPQQQPREVMPRPQPQQVRQAPPPQQQQREQPAPRAQPPHREAPPPKKDEHKDDKG